jgi:DNA-binding LytR/AlgR family response regulator
MRSIVPVLLIQEDVPASGIVSENGATHGPQLVSESSPVLKTLIVVKNEDTAFQLRALFRSDPHFDVVSDCVSELEVVSVLERTDLDVLVIDLNLPQLGSRPFLAAMHHLGRVLFMLDPDPRIEKLLQNKGLLYLRRDCDPGHFHAVAARLVQSGGARSRANAQKMVRFLSGRYRTRSSRLAVRVAERLLVLDQGEIYSVEAEGKTTWIHLGLESHQIAEPFSKLARRLDGKRLLKVNRRVLVNVMHIKQVSVESREGCSVWLHNDRIYRLPLHCARRLRKVVEALCKS